MIVHDWYVTPFDLKKAEIEARLPEGEDCEVLEIEIFVCPGDQDDDHVPYIYLTVFIWASAESPITDRQIDEWLSDHFEVVDIMCYKRLR